MYVWARVLIFLCIQLFVPSGPEYQDFINLHINLYCSQMCVTKMTLNFSDFCQENSSEMSTKSCKAGDDFMMSLFNLFSCLNNVPKALTQALQPYLERAHIWEHLYTLAGKVTTLLLCPNI